MDAWANSTAVVAESSRQGNISYLTERTLLITRQRFQIIEEELNDNWVEFPQKQYFANVVSWAQHHGCLLCSTQKMHHS